jgi:hypothetical protein
MGRKPVDEVALRAAITAHAPGDPVTFVVDRGGGASRPA